MHWVPLTMGKKMPKKLLVITELFNIAVNCFDAKKSALYNWVLIVTKRVVSGTQCLPPVGLVLEV